MTGDVQSAASAALCRRLLEHPTLQDAGGYVAHCQAADVNLVAEDVSSGSELGTLPVSLPLLVVTQRCLVVFSAATNWGNTAANWGNTAVLPLAGIFLTNPATYMYSVVVYCTGSCQFSRGLLIMS